MVLATRTSALNASLAVIRPKPRPDSPTASEISVIMLKSELLHEAPNPVSKKTPRLHHAARRRGDCLATRGAWARAWADLSPRRRAFQSTRRATSPCILRRAKAARVHRRAKPRG